MSQGKVYIHRSPRSNWLGKFAKVLNLDIEVHDISGEEFAKSFPLKKAPAFEDPTGFKLTEVIAIIEYFISIAEDKTLKGKTTKDAAQVLRWLSFLNQDVIDSWVQVNFVQKTEEGKAAATERLANLFKYIDGELENKVYIVGDYLTVADVYLFAVFPSMNATINITEESYPNIYKWHAFVKAEEPVIKAIFP